MVGRTRYSLPLSPSLERKFDALSAELDVRVLASAGAAARGDPRFRSCDRSGHARSTGPPSTRCCRSGSRASCASFRPDAVLAQGAQEAALAVLGRKLARVPTRVIADIHGDPAAPTRLYGSPTRKALAPIARRARPLRPPAERRRTDDLRVHVEARARGGRRARPPSSPPSWTSSPSRRASPRRSRRGRSRSSSACSSATRRSTCSRRRGGARLRAFPRRRCSSSGAGRSHEVPERLLAELPEQVRWTASLGDFGGRERPRRGHRPRPPLALGGSRPRRRRGVLPRAGCRREPGRGNPGSRRGRPHRPARAAGRRRRARRRSRPRRSPIARSPSGSGPRRTSPWGPGSRLPRSTPAGCAASSTRSPGPAPRLTRCGRTERNSS